MNELVSLIVPIYNVEKYLDRCVKSLISQTYKNIEIILVDDGATDSCGKKCDEYALRDNRIRVIHKKNGGLSDARNAGIEIASGDYIAFIDSDDFISDLYVEKLWNAHIRFDAEIVMCKMTSFCDEDELKKIRLTGTEKILSKKEFFEGYFDDKENTEVAWNKLYKKSLFDDIKYPIGKLHEDAFTTYKIIDKIDKIAVVDDILYYYYYNANGIMNSKIKIGRLDDITAHVESLRFFKNGNYTNATYGCSKWICTYCIYLLEHKKSDFVDYKSFFKEFKKIYKSARKELLKWGDLRKDWKIIVFLSAINLKLLVVYRNFLDFAYKIIKRK